MWGLLQHFNTNKIYNMDFGYLNLKSYFLNKVDETKIWIFYKKIHTNCNTTCGPYLVIFLDCTPM